MRMPDKTPTQFEISVLKWIIKWLVIPTFFLIIFSWCKGWYTCKSICNDKGFTDYQYSAGLRFQPESCHCFAENGVKVRDEATVGVRVF